MFEKHPQQISLLTYVNKYIFGYSFYYTTLFFISSLYNTSQSELRELRRSHEELVTATSRERADHEASMSELRSRIKIKAFEHGRLSLLVEEQRDGLNVAKKEANKQIQR